MAIPGAGDYGMAEGIVCSYPVTVTDGRYRVVQGLELNDFSRARLALTQRELLTERDMIAHLL
jgi:malate dehydrogenase